MTNAESSNAPASQPDRWDRLFQTGFQVGTLLLCCQLGMLFAAMDSPPYRMTRDALTALHALRDQMGLKNQTYSGDTWGIEPQATRGVTIHIPERSQPGGTLFGSTHEHYVRLIDADGKVLHQWGRPYRELFQGRPGFDAWMGEMDAFVRRSQVFPNGDLLALYETSMTTPNGLGLVKFDKDSNVLWQLDRRTHHDFTTDEQGMIFVLTQTICGEPHPAFPKLTTPYIDDSLSIVSPEGVELQSFSLLDVLGKSQFARPRTMLMYGDGDALHSNTVQVVTAEFAAHHSGLEAGDLLVCLRNLNLLVAIRPATEEVVWGTTGPWHHPHDPNILPNGNLLIFDNCYAQGTVAGSRVIEFNPRTHGIEWEFGATESFRFRSDVRACQQRLPNGNTLITESDRGRLREVTREGELVWEFVQPHTGGPDQNLVPVIMGATRVDLEPLVFLNEAE
ncbi:MAG: hypothetical protein KDA58_01420 [Planctomycetaceae bacterium]|nr:hypothetical protein [Planctomycetaceae bacterium]